MITNAGITVINKNDSKYVATPIYGVAFFEKVERMVTEKGLISANHVNIYIPITDEISDGIFFKPQETLIVKGIVDIDGIAITEILNKYNVKTVYHVAKNKYGSQCMHHWKIGAK